MTDSIMSSNIITGTDGNDRLISGFGNSQMTGGPGGDIFVIIPNDQSITIITDFDVNDAFEKIDLTKFKSINDFKDVHISTDDSKTYIQVQYQQIILNNVTPTNLSKNSFIGPWSAAMIIKSYDVGSLIDSFHFQPKNLPH